ncbi:protein of unknown function [Candidatus Hydrogenisulfobacillus filiaventi]|uniref:Uncharacterized protein n=1 Tax=Candidatus Hydrogenisulfobacillus filiaventi TaxID=2707344 RepID=A0A6F8ZDC6_9FIRM|nr:protein of unknown function [Candidatus Hydrogenisulfobacillus filiaventi]
MLPPQDRAGGALEPLPAGGGPGGRRKERPSADAGAARAAGPF